MEGTKMKEKKTKEPEMQEEKCTCGCKEEKSSCGCEDEKCSCGRGDECDCGPECDCGCNEGKDCTCGCEGGGSELDKKLADEYLALARQIQADFDNYRKRTQEQMENVRTDGKVEALNIFLPVVDVLEKALKMVTDEKSNEGLQMVLNSLNNSMKNMGVERMELKGKPFAPETAMAIASLNDNSMEDGIVIEEVTSGYKLKNKIIRYAQVVVNKIEK